MSLNPIVFTEKIVRSFLRYQLTAYPFADERLLAQMRQLLSLDATRNSPLLKGPFISVSRPFRSGAAVDALARRLRGQTQGSPRRKTQRHGLPTRRGLLA